MSRKPALKLDDIRDAVLARWSASAGPLHPLVEGAESQAFWFRDGGQDFVLRVNRSADGFRKDAYAYEHFSSAKLPIPKVMTIGQVDPDHAFCVSERIAGVTLQDASEAAIDRLLDATDQVAGAIHACDVSGTAGYGPFDASGTGAFTSWRAFLVSVLHSPVDEWERVRERTDRRLVDDLFQAFEALLPFCPEERALIHADFGSNNVLTDGAAITGVIDWEEAAYGDPVFDMRSFWSPWLMCVRKQTDYWARQAWRIERYRERQRCYDLRTALTEIYESALGGDAKTLRWVESRARELLGAANLA